MMRIIRDHLERITNDIDAGNSNLTEADAIEVLEAIRRLTNKEEIISKYSACRYLNVSRATFDNYVKAGKLPRGVHRPGFKELGYRKKDLDEFIKFHKK